MRSLYIIVLLLSSIFVTSCYKYNYAEGTIEYDIEKEYVESESGVRSVTVTYVDSFDTRTLTNSIQQYREIIDSCGSIIGDASIIQTLLPNANTIKNIVYQFHPSGDYSYKKYLVEANVKYENKSIYAYVWSSPNHKIEFSNWERDEKENPSAKLLSEINEYNKYCLTIDSLISLTKLDKSTLLRLKNTELARLERVRIENEKAAEKAEKERVKEALKEIRVLYQELMIYKRSEPFYKYGFTKEPYITWRRKVEGLDSRISKSIAGEYGFTVSEMISIATHYIASYGQDDDYTMYVRNHIERAIR